MNGVIGMVDLLENTTLSDEQMEHLEIIRASSDSLMITINDILDFSKIESGKLELEDRDFSLREMVESIMDDFGEAARQKSLDLFYLMDPHVPDFVKGDEVRMKQILSNLVGNAVKFTNQGEVFPAPVQPGNAGRGRSADHSIPGERYRHWYTR